MFARKWAPAAAALAIFAGASALQASDAFTLRLDLGKTVATRQLGGNAGTYTLDMDMNKDADTIPVWGRHWGGGWGHRGWGGYGYRGWGGYGYRSWGWGGWGYRPYWGGYWGGYRPYYYSYAPSYYYPYTYYYPGAYSYYYSPWGCSYTLPTVSLSIGSVSAAISANPPAVDLNIKPRVLPKAPANSITPPQPDGTYPYDGGPQNPVPMPPKTEPSPTKQPTPSVPLEGRLVSLPKSGPFVYPAYGEKPRPIAALVRTVVVNTKAAPKTGR